MSKYITVKRRKGCDAIVSATRTEVIINYTAYYMVFPRTTTTENHPVASMLIVLVDRLHHGGMGLLTFILPFSCRVVLAVPAELFLPLFIIEPVLPSLRILAL